MGREWIYTSKNNQWEITIDDWRGTVTQDERSGAWHLVIERPDERHEGPDVLQPHQGRDWCLAEIAYWQARAERGLG